VGVVVRLAKSVTSVHALIQIFWDPVIGIETSLRGGQPRIHRSIPGRGRYFSILRSVITGCALPLPKPLIHWVPQALSSGLKQLGHEGDHSFPSIAFTASCTETNLALSVFGVT